MTTVQSFSASGEDVINRTIDVYTQETPKPGAEDFALYYEIERTSKLIEDGDYKRVRFPKLTASSSLRICADSSAVPG